jgi:hypothetical protein
MASPVTTRVPLDIGAIHFIGIGGAYRDIIVRELI